MRDKYTYISAVIAALLGFVIYSYLASRAVSSLSTVSGPLWLWVFGGAVFGFFISMIAVQKWRIITAVLAAVIGLLAFGSFYVITTLAWIVALAALASSIVGLFQSPRQLA